MTKIKGNLQEETNSLEAQTQWKYIRTNIAHINIIIQNTGSVGLHIYREWTIPDCPNKLLYTNQGEEEM
jgi:hypothetical protein